MNEQKRQGQKEKVMGKINEIKKNVETFIADVNVADLKESLNTMVKDAQKDFNKLVDKDLENLKSKFRKEKSALEKKAQKFFDNHKKEISALQAKFEKLVKKTQKSPAAKAPAKAATSTKKKVTPKIAKIVKVTKTAAPVKRTTKKATKK